MSEHVAYSYELRSAMAGRWRGGIGVVEGKTGAWGGYQGGQRIWRCEHEHRSADAAQTCAERHLRVVSAKAAGQSIDGAT